ncbi:helix-turn-helix domain-containing protein [Paenibacillus sinopodophylli]|uniref:helix-turn-helix domain-containing protein n=1 Tax=Paenibacillus sinopodophylli TaxID=1837342 RepID=UPI00110CDDE0|nr:helix-turn-helix domain-containing protein [Paenibacillus sinopodophylli]
MYRMLIVDDEKLLLDGLYELFLESEGHQLELYKASSAIEALAVMSQNRIDILMSDIKMPKMTGLELGDRVKQSWPECKLIFLTGFDEFDYVHHAINNGAQNYILKSEGDEAIVQAVRLAVAELDKHMAVETLLKQARETQRQQAVHHRSLMLSDVLNGLQPFEKLSQATKDMFGIRLIANRPLTMVAARLDLASSALRFSEKELMLTALHSVCVRYLSGYVNMMDVVYNREYYVLFLQVQDHTIPHPEGIRTFLQGSLETIQQTVEKSTGRTVSFAYTASPVEFDEVPRQFTTLKALLSQYYAEKQIIVTDKNLSFNAQSNDEEVRGFIEVFHKKANALDLYLETGKREEVQAIVKELGSYSGWPAIDDIRYIEMYYAVALRFLTAANKYGMDRDSLVGPHIAKLLHPAAFLERREGIVLLEHMINVFESYHDAQSSRLRGDVLGTVLKHIEMHLDGDLSMTHLAELVYLNPDYLSRLFKQAKGITISEYIAVLKVQRAKELLSEPQLRIQDIAKSLGFTSAGYFSRFFKKETGQTPQEFRTKG